MCSANKQNFNHEDTIMKKYLLIAAACVLFSQTASAASLQGEFGINLLQKVDTSRMQAQQGPDGSVDTSGPATYAFTPASNDLGVAFDEYNFSTDASRTTIASIYANKTFASEQQCQAQLQSVKANTAKKYGEPSYSSANMLHFVDSNSKFKTASIGCSQNVMTFVMNDVGSNLKF